ncbi:betaine/proline/choline family ABC transporter ATP-binding protein [Clostridium hydrogeniformans]|uniref:betaine/proline/choline family ABC transporter ATP-binding protein n=1 Tax=Clostridium hydrogeniformans TaxID=349933 RepID=UPI0004836624|nr:betaine/proline/choline family ABC transporter ATP-binding protein [Clostridium hydrogeniformans]
MIVFNNIKKSYNKNTIIEKFNLTINNGEFVVFIGPSGCGKTTMLKMINKLITPTSGNIEIDGGDIANIDSVKLRRNIGYVIQQTGIFPHMTIKENIGIILKLTKTEENKIDEKVRELLTLVGLEPEKYMNRYPKELSGGQQQRVGVARALATDPDIILMDEPFSALDPITRNSLQEELFNLQQEVKKIIVFVTHDMDEAIKLADKICIMNKGEIYQYDTPENILRNPANEFVESFIGKDRIWNNPEYIKAKDVMIKNPITTNGRRNVLQSIEIMRNNKVDSLMVVDKQNLLKGIVTIKSIKAYINDNSNIEDIMEKNLITVDENSNIVDILKIMNNNNIGYVPVINSSCELKGLVTRSSLISVMSEKYIYEEERKE